MKSFIYAILITIIIPSMFLSQGNSWGNRNEFNLGQRNYKHENGQWYKKGAQETKEKIYPKRLIVKKKNGKDLSKVDFNNLSVAGVDIISKKLLGGYYVVSIKDDDDPFSIAEMLFNESSFEYVEFDAQMKLSSTPDDDYWNDSWYAGGGVWMTGQWNLKSDRLNMPWAWDITTGDSLTILAIIEMGIDITHEDIKDNIWENTLEVNGTTGIDDDQNGFIDDYNGWRFGYSSNNNDVTNGQDARHGINVAGIAIARANNNKGIAGIAGGWDNTRGVSLMTLVRNETDGGGAGDTLYSSSVMEAVDYIAANSADVVNMSFGSSFDHSGIKDAINIASETPYNCIFVASTGNHPLTTDPVDVTYPAKYSKVISVGAVDSDDDIMLLSNYDLGGSSDGKDIDVVAPGEVITTGESDTYEAFFETSAAAPHVSGLVSLIRSINSGLTYSQVRTILSNTTNNSPATWNQYYGYGRINAYKALKYTLENYGGTIGGNGKTVTFHEDITIESGKTLTIATGTTVKFEPGDGLTVEGTLIADGVTFTSTSTSKWDGIFMDGASSSSVIKNCTITKAYRGIHLDNTSMTVELNEISNITEYGIYIYGCSPIILNNYIHDTDDYGVAVNGSSAPYIRKNSIKECEGGVFGFHTSQSFKMMGYSGNYYGLNEIEDFEDEAVLITGGSPSLGIYGSSTYKRGYNNIIKGSGTVAKNTTTSEVMAEKNYWGGTPQSYWFTGSFSYDPYLSSSYSSAGSTLEKVLDIEPDKQLLMEGSDLSDSKSYQLSSDKFKQLISEYPDSKYAGIALAWSMIAHNKAKDLESQRSYVQEHTTHKNERVRNSALLWLQTLEAKSGNKDKSAEVVNSTSVNDAVGVEIRLNLANDLLNLYDDKVNAEAIFSEIVKYDDSPPILRTIEAIKKTARYSDQRDLGEENLKKEVENVTIINESSLLNAYPNPFNPTTTINYQLQDKAYVNLVIYNSIGQEVAVLINQQKEQGIHSVDFNASNLPSGLYIYRLQVQTPDGKGNYSEAKKMILMK